MKKVFFVIASAFMMAICASCEKSGTAIDDDGGADASGAVDLGLSVKWASCNLGASKPEELGECYAWGETSPKTEFTETNYKYYTGTFIEIDFYKTDIFTKYNTYPESINPDNLTQLEKDDDAVYKKLGGKWRTPTYEEWKELKRNCTWTRQFCNGVLGVEVKSSKNGKTIFIPVDGDELAGDYMSSTLDPDGRTFYGKRQKNSYCISWCIDLETVNADVHHCTSVRHFGYFIRPVQDK